MDPDGETVIVALGSNLGDSGQIIRWAQSQLRQFASGNWKQSSLWKSTPVDCPPGSPAFINCVVSFSPKPGETPQTLLLKLQELEKQAGRRRKKILNEPRPLDLDLIAYGEVLVRSETLILPHPRAHQRRFVLAPLAEIMPEFRLPGRSETSADLLRGLATNEIVEKL